MFEDMGTIIYITNVYVFLRVCTPIVDYICSTFSVRGGLAVTISHLGSNARTSDIYSSH